SCFLIDIKIFLLGILALSIILFYSYTKRFTYLCHYVLGLGIGIAPVGAWLVIKDSLELTPIFFFLGLMFHIAGFDILYSTQDYEFDKQNSLHSIPVRFGIFKALWISRFTHLFSIFFLILPYFHSGLGNLYLVLVFIIGILFMIEHSLVSPNDLSKVPIAFFHVNISISIVLFLGVLFDNWSLLLEAIRRKF
ncbi:MAG: UbiA family prenyltransferase, partial [Leptospiraceae bacterium]|nr:UbiA family prenyltransferase [Leptospiraceae bacterium]